MSIKLCVLGTEETFGKFATTFVCLYDALKEAISFQNEDTECLAGECDCGSESRGEWAGVHDRDCPSICPDHRCKGNGCMVQRVNRWRAAIARAEEVT